MDIKAELVEARETIRHLTEAPTTLAYRGFSPGPAARVILERLFQARVPLGQDYLRSCIARALSRSDNGSQSIDVHIYRLRKKLAALDPPIEILNVRDRGWILDDTNRQRLAELRTWNPVMTPEVFLPTVLVPGLHWLDQHLGAIPPDSPEARLVLLAIMGQESAWKFHIQSGNGPAHGYAQFEQGNPRTRGGVTGVLMHPTTEELAKKVCAAAGVPADATRVWGLMATAAGDNLSIAFARLLLWSDRHSLPDYGDEEGAWVCYIRNWRPGKPSRSRWATVYSQALAADKAFVPGVRT